MSSQVYNQTLRPCPFLIAVKLGITSTSLIDYGVGGGGREWEEIGMQEDRGQKSVLGHFYFIQCSSLGRNY